MPVADARYWFARRFPVGHPRNAMSPVNRAGYAVVVGFVGAMLVGAVGWAALTQLGLFVVGLAVFVILTAAAGGAFVWLAQVKGDHQRTVADYRKMYAES